MTACTNTKNIIQRSYGSTAYGVCTNDNLSLISNHNSDLNNPFNPFWYLNNNSTVTNYDNPDKNCDNFNKNNDNLDKNCDSSNKNNDNSYLDNDIRNCYALDNRCYVEKLGKQLKDLLKCIDINDSYLSNYETITVVGK